MLRSKLNSVRPRTMDKDPAVEGRETNEEAVISLQLMLGQG